MDKEDVIGRFIHYSAILFPRILVALSIVMLAKNPYGSFFIMGRGVIHAVSAIGLGTAFIFIYHRLAYLFPLVRIIITLCFTVLSIHLYDFMWSLSKYLQIGIGFRLLPLIFVFIVGVLIERFDNKHGILNLNKSQAKKTVIFLLLIFVSAFIMMMNGGFYENMELYEQGTGSNPHVGSVGWILGKITGFWLLVPLISGGNFKAELRLDPRVLVW